MLCLKRIFGIADDLKIDKPIVDPVIDFNGLQNDFDGLLLKSWYLDKIKQLSYNIECFSLWVPSALRQPTVILHRKILFVILALNLFRTRPLLLRTLEKRLPGCKHSTHIPPTNIFGTLSRIIHNLLWRISQSLRTYMVTTFTFTPKVIMH